MKEGSGVVVVVVTEVEGLSVVGLDEEAEEFEGEEGGLLFGLFF